VNGGPNDGARAGDVVAGRYRLHEVVPDGARLQWRATDTTTGRSVVLEELDPEHPRERAVRAAAVQHPHLVAILDVVEERGAAWLVREGELAPSLAQLVDRYGPMAAAPAAVIGAQVASALAAVHTAGLVHGDLTPESIRVGEGGSGPVAKLTGLGVPPAAGATTDSAADVRALGAALHVAIEDHVTGGAPVRIAEPLGTVLQQLTADDPAERPTAAQAHVELARLAAAPATTPEIAARPGPPPTAPPARRRSRVLATVGAGAVLVVALVVALVAVAPAARTPALPPVPTAMPPLTPVDERTLDPCSLIDVAALAPVGPAQIIPGYGVFSACTAEIPLPVDTLNIDVELLTDAEAAAGSVDLGRRTPEAPVVVSGPSDFYFCARYVLLPGSHVVSVSAVRYGYTDRPDFCGIAERAAAAAAARVADGAFTPRSWEADRTALGTVRACALLDQAWVAAAASVSGADATGTPVDGNAGWSCRWGPVSLDFIREAAPGTPLHYGDPVTIGGRPGMTRSDYGGSCRAYVPQRLFTAPDGVPRAEYVRIIVNGAADTPTICGAAVPLAERVATRLPAFGG
jgi:eukaryotic-like serine/threonine-protein kinase